MASIYKIAHISDLHISSAPHKQPYKMLVGKRIIGALKYYVGNRRVHFANSDFRTKKLLEDIRITNVNHIVCTGDISSMSYESEFKRASEIFFDFSEINKFTLIPGNHDRYTNYSYNNNRFEHWFKGLSPARVSYPFLKELNDKIVLIALDASSPTILFDASGKCGLEQLKKLEYLLNSEKLDNKLIFLMLHFGLCGPDKKPVETMFKLRDYRHLIDIIKKSKNKINLTLHGHHHECFYLNYNDLNFLCSGSATDTNSSCGYNIIHIDSYNLGLRIERRNWSIENQRYEHNSFLNKM